MAHLKLLSSLGCRCQLLILHCCPVWWWCRYKAKCEMLLRKMDGEKIVQNYGFFTKLQNGDGGDMLHDRRQRQLSRTRTVIFLRYDTLPTSKSRRRWPGNPNGRSKFHNLCLFMLARSQLMHRQRLRSWWGFWQLPEIAQMARCRRQTHSQRWPGKINGWSKFRDLRLFTLARSQLTLRWQLRGWWRLPEIVQTACWRRRKHHRRRPGDDQDWLKFRNYENVCLRDHAKPLKKPLFAVRMPLLWWHCALFFSYYNSQQLLNYEK